MLSVENVPLSTFIEHQPQFHVGTLEGVWKGSGRRMRGYRSGCGPLQIVLSKLPGGYSMQSVASVQEDSHYCQSIWIWKRMYFLTVACLLATGSSKISEAQPSYLGKWTLNP